MPLGPRCPHCNRLVPVVRTQWHLGKTFRCGRCDTPLVVPRSNATTLGLGLFILFWLLRSRFPAELGGQFGLAALLLLVGLPVTYLLTRVERSESEASQ